MKTFEVTTRADAAERVPESVLYRRLCCKVTTLFERQTSHTNVLVLFCFQIQFGLNHNVPAILPAKVEAAS